MPSTFGTFKAAQDANAV
jgi:hypothetical protein